jgi:hypothetical protein
LEAFTNLEKTDMVLIYSEAPGHSELARQIYGERFPQRILPNARTFANVVQHLRDFERFKMIKRDLGRQRKDRILVAEEEISSRNDANQPQTITRRIADYLGVSQFVVWLRVQNAAPEIREYRGSLRTNWQKDQSQFILLKIYHFLFILNN